jgi:hypothetical protein
MRPAEVSFKFEDGKEAGTLADGPAPASVSPGAEYYRVYYAYTY